MRHNALLLRVIAGLALVALLPPLHACEMLPALPSPPPGALRVTDFGALPDDDLNDDAAIARALRALKPGGWLVFPPGRYRQAHSVLVTTPGVTLWGPGATLQATDPRDHTLGLRADGVRLYGLTLTARPDQRRSEPAQARISLYRDRSDNPAGTTPQRGNVVRGVTVDGAGSVGILVHGMADFTIAGNTVRRTLADGIHVTGASHHGRVLGNQVRDTGDDLISIVSYDDAPPVRDVLVQGNDVAGARWGRGLTVVGGEHLTLRGNTVTGVAHGAGILLAEQLGLPEGVQIGALVRGEEVLIAHHDTVIETDDHVIVFLPSKRQVRAVEKLFQVGATFF